MIADCIANNRLLSDCSVDICTGVHDNIANLPSLLCARQLLALSILLLTATSC